MLAQEAALSTSTYFDAVAGTPGFGQALHRTLVEIRRSGITPGRAERGRARLTRTREARRPRRPRAPPRRAEGRPLRRRRRARRGRRRAPRRRSAARLRPLGSARADPSRAIAGIGAVRVYLPQTSPVADRAHASFREWLRDGARRHDRGTRGRGATQRPWATSSASLAPEPRSSRPSRRDGPHRLRARSEPRGARRPSHMPAVGARGRDRLPRDGDRLPAGRSLSPAARRRPARGEAARVHRRGHSALRAAARPARARAARPAQR